MSLFFADVYEVVRRIPPGKVATYQDVAALAGRPRAARAVGMAMSRNPDAATIPCHRLVGSDGSLRGYGFGNGVPTKLKLLQQEGVAFKGDKADLRVSRWRFS